MIAMTPELRQAVAAAGGKPLRIEVPETHRVYVLVEEEQLDRAAAGPDDTPGHPRAENAVSVEFTYPAIDEAFREGWETPAMAEYDDYEAHRR